MCAPARSDGSLKINESFGSGSWWQWEKNPFLLCLFDCNHFLYKWHICVLVCVSLSFSLSVSLCLSLHLFLSISVSLSLSLSPSLSLSVSLSLSLSICLSVSLSLMLAMWNYSSQAEYHLSLSVGDLLCVLGNVEVCLLKWSHLSLKLHSLPVLQCTHIKLRVNYMSHTFSCAYVCVTDVHVLDMCMS